MGRGPPAQYPVAIIEAENEIKALKIHHPQGWQVLPAAGRQGRVAQGCRNFPARGVKKLRVPRKNEKWLVTPPAPARSGRSGVPPPPLMPLGGAVEVEGYGWQGGSGTRRRGQRKGRAGVAAVPMGAAACWGGRG